MMLFLKEISEDSAQWLLAWSEVLLLISAVTLAIGIIGEWPESEQWRTRLWYKAAKAAVLLGVIGELLGDGGIFEASARLQLIQDKTVQEARTNAASANERAAILALDLENAHTETARADAILLGEQRLTARERMRLERLERIVLPRSIDPTIAPQLVEALKAGGFQPINIAIVMQRESSAYGFTLMNILNDAGLLAGVAWLPKDSKAPNLLMVTVDADGPRLADLLWQKFQIGQGWRAEIERGADPTKTDGTLAGVPTDRNCLVVGSNSEAAWQGMPGQPGEGRDEHGRPVPAPQ
jgi:hypothetical protein